MSWHIDIEELKRRIPLEDYIARHIGELKKRGGEWWGECPFHSDTSPSLRVNISKQCWRCDPCGFGGSVIDFVMRLRGCSVADALRALAEEVSMAPVDRKPERVATYRYTDEQGQLLGIKERWEPGKNGRSKGYVWRMPDGRVGKPQGVAMLYRAVGVAVAKRLGQRIYVVEGEKCVEAVVSLGLVATSNEDGAGKWTRSHAELLKGARVTLVADNDEAGAKHMDAVAASLAGVAAEVRRLVLPDLKAKGDVADWIAAGGTKEQLESLAEAAPLVGNAPSPARGGGRSTQAAIADVVNECAALKRSLAFDVNQNAVMLVDAPPWHCDGPYPRRLGDVDVTRAIIYLEREHGVVTSPPRVFDALAELAERTKFNPVGRYLEALQWDGVPRLSSWLTNLFGVKDDGQGYVSAVGRAWLISAVARGLHPGCKVDHVLVLEGEQGVGKSSGLRALAGDEWFMDHMPDLGSKDAAMITGRYWMHELAELASLSRSDIERMKQFLTQQDDEYRPAYGRLPVRVPRRCVFVATTNEAKYLRDPTGSRRFWPVKVSTIDVPRIKAEREQLLAEAVAAYRAGEPWHLSKEMTSLALGEQEERTPEDPWETILERFVSGRDFVTVNEALDALGFDKSKKDIAAAQRVGRIFVHRLKWQPTRRRVGGALERGWVGTYQQPPLK